MSVELINICTSVDTNNVCLETEFVSAYLLPPDSAPMLGLLLAGGFDSETALLGFMGVITLFVTGLTVGIVISQIRKARSV